MNDIFTRLQAFHSDVDQITSRAGGILRCETCRRTDTPKGEYWRTGWPRCCGYTMSWWTQRQIDAGEVDGL